MVGLSAECKVKWKAVEHHCAVLWFWPMDHQKKKWDTQFISSYSISSALLWQVFAIR